MPFSYQSKRIDTKVLLSWKGRHISHFFINISSMVTLWLSNDPRMFKSIELSPRNRCEFVIGWPKNHISGYTSGTGSHRHDTFTLDLCPHLSFKTSPSLSKSVQPSPRNRSRYIVRRRLRNLFGYISGTGSLRHNPFKLDQWHTRAFK